MAEKQVNILMEPSVHDMMKYRAKTLNIKIGQMAGNYVSSLEARLKRAYEIALLKERDPETDKQLIEAILCADEVGESEKSLHGRFQKIGVSTKKRKLPQTKWQPQFTYSDEAGVIGTDVHDN
jgi:hypothetical protein